MTESAATLQEWTELYAASIAYRQLEPWKCVLDDDVFGVKDPASGEIGYCCVMGELGEFFGLAVYLGAAGLAAMDRISSGEIGPTVEEAMFIQDCLLVSFGERRDQQSADLGIIKSLGLKFRGTGNWPLFRRHQPGYSPWFLTRDEVRFLTVALQQANEVVTRCAQDSELLAPPKPNVHFVRVPVPSESGLIWTDAWLAPAPMEPVAKEEIKVFNEVRLESIHRAAYPRRGTWQADFDYLPAPVAERSKRPYYPYFFMCTESSSDLILCASIAEPSRHQVEFQEQFYKAAEQVRTLPETVCVSRQHTYDLLAPIAGRLGFKVKKVASLRSLEEARRSMMEFMLR